jgi:acetylglutamate kinase
VTDAVVLKLGGELLETPERLQRIAVAIVVLARRGALAVVHGGGRDIDAELARHGIEKRAVDGIRITDEPTLSVVIGVLAGRVNTRLVAAVVAAGGRAVGLTGADDGVGLVRAAPPHRAADGRTVDLGLVGTPAGAGRPALIADLWRAGYIPILASIGMGRDGRLYNVNADTFAAHLAARLGATRLIIAGGTAGVLDRRGDTIPRLAPGGIARLIADGDANAGMVAKLTACRDALEAGVGEIRIVDGRETTDFASAAGTTLVREAAA